jgi:hypothetical protein
MRSIRFITLAAALPLALSLAACSSSRDVEVTGEVSAAQVQGEIFLEFFDTDGDQPESVHTATLSAPGVFTETVPLAGDKVLIRAIDDADGDGACSAGERWAEVEADIDENDEVKDVLLVLAQKPCPE